VKNFGVVYVAFGAPYLAMAIVSLISLRVTNPSIPVCIVTNVVRQPPKKSWWQPEIGDEWIYLDKLTEENRNAKTNAYKLSPFDRTLYLDADTMVLTDISIVYLFLDYFDILLCSVYNPGKREKRRILGKKLRYTEDGHFNSGVFGFKRCDAAEEFFSLWNERYNKLGYRLDQPSLVEAYFLSRARLFPLPNRWNRGDLWADMSGARDRIDIWHYKVRLEPLVEKLMVKAVSWFGGDETQLAQTRDFILSRRRLRHHYSPYWQFRRLVTKLRGDQSRRLESHANGNQWLSWIRDGD
jgi:hypothetical protein